MRLYLCTYTLIALFFYIKNNYYFCYHSITVRNGLSTWSFPTKYSTSLPHTWVRSLSCALHIQWWQENSGDVVFQEMLTISEIFHRQKQSERYAYLKVVIRSNVLPTFFLDLFILIIFQREKIIDFRVFNLF